MTTYTPTPEGGQTESSNKFLWYTMREGSGYSDDLDIHGFKEQVGGVLDGQIIKCFIECLSEAEASAKYPDIRFGSRWTDPVVSLTHLSDREGYSDDYEDGE